MLNKCPVLGALDDAVNKTDKNIRPHAAYILVRGINNKHETQ